MTRNSWIAYQEERDATTNIRIRAKMRRDEQAVIDYVRAIRRRKARVCSQADCWPPRWLSKAQDRLEAAGVIVAEAHFGRKDTARNRSWGIHFRAIRNAKPITKVPRRKAA